MNKTLMIAGLLFVAVVVGGRSLRPLLRERERALSVERARKMMQSWDANQFLAVTDQGAKSLIARSVEGVVPQWDIARRKTLIDSIQKQLDYIAEPSFEEFVHSRTNGAACTFTNGGMQRKVLALYGIKVPQNSTELDVIRSIWSTMMETNSLLGVAGISEIAPQTVRAEYFDTKAGPPSTQSREVYGFLTPSTATDSGIHPKETSDQVNSETPEFFVLSFIGQTAPVRRSGPVLLAWRKDPKDEEWRPWRMVVEASMQVSEMF